MSGDHTEITTTTGYSGHEVAHHADADHERPEDWGWNAELGKLARVAAFLSAVVMLILLIGNHRGRVEDVWLLLVAASIFGLLIRDALRRRKSWRN